MRAKTKQAKITKNHAKSERCRYILKENIVMDLKFELPAGLRALICGRRSGDHETTDGLGDDPVPDAYNIPSKKGGI